MEAERPEVVTKPDRSPDIVIKPGHAVWWDEMVFMHVYGHVYKIEVSQTDGTLCFAEGHKLGGVLPALNELYRKWEFETFESKFFGEE